MSELLDMKWRTGRKVGRTIYAQLGPEPSEMDPLIGVMDTGDLADSAVEGHNQCLDGYEAWMGAIGGAIERRERKAPPGDRRGFRVDL